MKPELYDSLEKIYFHCQAFCREQERWPSYYRRRYIEFLSYLEVLGNGPYGKVLELGCGNGYQSAFLSKIADKVIATDLPEEDMETHTPGMKVAEDLHKQLKINNVDLVPCSAENLPFEDGSFDLVYSSHVLEHIPDKEKALKEIYRVLKKGGLHFCVVPTRAEKCYAFVNFYTYLISRVFARIFSYTRKKKLSPVTDDRIANATTSSSSVLRDFPFPPPHGHYKHYLDEWKAWSPSRWMSLVCSCGSVKKVAHLTTQFNPLLSLLGGVFPRLATAIHAVTRKAELRLGKSPFFRSIGINTVILVQKTGE